MLLGLWSYTYPVFEGKSYFWVGFWISGLLQLLAGMGMAFYLLEQNARKLEAQNAKLQQLDQLKMNFLSTVSHELRTPLTCIIGYLELMDDGVGGELTTQQSAFVDGMKRSSQQLAELVNSLLDSVQIEKGTLKVERRRLDLVATVSDTLGSLAPLCEKKRLTFERVFPPALPPALGDARRVAQVLNNLVGNAVKFTPEGGSVRVAVSLEPDGLLSVSVTDTGIGIPDDKLAQVFEPFYQADNSLTRQHGGSGLGLPIARSLVEAMGGTLMIESREGAGSTFRFTLPCEAPELRAAVQEAQATLLS
jgi:signal transduction histidine kinase